MPLFVREPSSGIVIERTPRRSSLRPWLWLNLVSLDAPLVALLWQVLLQRCAALPASFESSAALVLSVWLIYVCDRLLDALRWPATPVAPRHAFYRRHWQAFMWSAVIGFLTLGALCEKLEPHILRDGVMLAAAVGAYLLVVHVSPKRWQSLWPKELVVGIVFSAGTLLPVWSSRPLQQDQLVLPIVVFAVLCTLNCIAIEFWEWRHYGGDSQPHVWTVAAGCHLSALTLGAGAIAALAFVADAETMRPFYAAALISSALLFLLAKRRERMQTEMVRVLADAALLTPLAVAAFAWL